MIFTLLIINFFQKESVLNWAEGKAWMKSVLGALSGTMPTALGKPYRPD
ncbi:MAG: hypothetical protein IMF10_03550 [Proteobacteria bacterium]|nr:hypothetical protein [Pseudomonadota bacterium]